MRDRAFLDTNVLVYAFDTAEKVKRRRARQILRAATDEGSSFVISTQVLQEFYVTVTRKFRPPLAEQDAERTVRELMRLPLVHIDPQLVLDAIQTSRTFRLSLWDGLIIAAAAAAGCRRLLTEDLQDGLQIGSLTVVNPFAA